MPDSKFTIQVTAKDDTHSIAEKVKRNFGQLGRGLEGVEHGAKGLRVFGGLGGEIGKSLGELARGAALSTRFGSAAVTVAELAGRTLDRNRARTQSVGEAARKATGQVQALAKAQTVSQPTKGWRTGWEEPAMGPWGPRPNSLGELAKPTLAGMAGMDLGEAASGAGVFEGAAAIAVGSLAALATGYIAAAAGAQKLTGEWAKGNQALDQNARMLNMTTTQLWALQSAGEHLSVPKDVTGQSLSNLGKTLNDAHGGRNQAAVVLMHNLGITDQIKRPGDKIDLQLALRQAQAAYRRYPNAQTRADIAGLLGIDPRLAQADPRQFDAWFNEAASSGNAPTKKEIEESRQNVQNMTDFGERLGGVYNRTMGGAVAPWANANLDIVNGALDVLQGHAGNGVRELGAGFGHHFQSMWNLTPFGVAAHVMPGKTIAEAIGGLFGGKTADRRTGQGSTVANAVRANPSLGEMARRGTLAAKVEPDGFGRRIESLLASVLGAPADATEQPQAKKSAPAAVGPHPSLAQLAGDGLGRRLSIDWPALGKAAQSELRVLLGRSVANPVRGRASLAETAAQGSLVAKVPPEAFGTRLGDIVTAAKADAAAIEQAWTPLSEFFARLWTSVDDVFRDGWGLIKPEVDEIAAAARLMGSIGEAAGGFVISGGKGPAAKHLGQTLSAAGHDLPAIGGNLLRHTLGMARNNPGNLRTTHGGFASLGTLAEGVHRMGWQLQRYQDRYGLNDIASIVSRYAPSSENDTAGYIAAVSRRTGWGAHQKLNLNDPKQLATLEAAMIHQEQGFDPVKREDILRALTAGSQPAEVNGKVHVQVHLPNAPAGTRAVASAQGAARTSVKIGHAMPAPG